MSVVIPAKYESEYIVPTVKYTLENMENLVKEIIIVDDVSEIPVNEIFDLALTQYERVEVESITRRNYGNYLIDNNNLFSNFENSVVCCYS